jgi:ATP-dependent Clp protease ATP-binding subunit ClpA
VFERFTQDARASVYGAREEARTLRDPRIDTSHLLVGIALQPQSIGAIALRRLGLDAETIRADVQRRREAFGPEDAELLRGIGIDLDEVRRSVEESFGPGTLDTGSPAGRGGRIPLAPDAKKALELAVREAVRVGDTSIRSEHLLLGLVRDPRCPASRLLSARGADAPAVRAAVQQVKTDRGEDHGRTA